MTDEMSGDLVLQAQRRLVSAFMQGLREQDGSPRCIETHLSFVVLAGAHAYKIKKALDVGFADFRTLAARRHDCHEELRLNRRQAASVYLDVLALQGTCEAPWLGPDADDALEYMVHMRRFGDEGLWSQLLAQDALDGPAVDALAASVASLHAGAACAPEDADWGRPALVMAPVRDNFAALATHPDPAQQQVLERLRVWSEAEGARLGGLMAARRETGRVRECHGDLHPGNVVMLDGSPLLFDCIEFNPAFRWIDTMADVAFMVMELQRAGHRDLAARFLDRYLEADGDYAGVPLLRFYCVYRALVRAKVAMLQATQSGMPASARHQAWALCAAYLTHAARDLAPPAPLLVMTCGVSGSGKTHAARQLVEGLGALTLRTDVLRKRLHGLAPSQTGGHAVGQGLYSAAASAATYAELERLAAIVLGAGYPVVADAACLRRAQRDGLRRVAVDAGLPWLWLACEAPEEVLAARITARQKAGGDASDAGLEVLAAQRDSVEPLAADEQEHALRVDTRVLQGAALCAAVLNLAHRGQADVQPA